MIERVDTHLLSVTQKAHNRFIGLVHSCIIILICPLFVFTDGLVPYDGIPVEELTTVALPVTVMYILLASMGIVFAVLCLTFNFIFRKRK